MHDRDSIVFAAIVLVSAVHRGLDWAGPAQLVESLLLTNHVASVKCRSHCLIVLPSLAFNVVFKFIALLNFSCSWCMIRNVVPPFNTIFPSPGVYKAVLEMSPVV